MNHYCLLLLIRTWFRWISYESSKYVLAFLGSLMYKKKSFHIITYNLSKVEWVYGCSHKLVFFGWFFWLGLSNIVDLLKAYMFLTLLQVFIGFNFSVFLWRWLCVKHIGLHHDALPSVLLEYWEQRKPSKYIWTYTYKLGTHI